MYRRGDRVQFREKWQDPGDEEIVFVVVEDESKGRVTVEARLGLPINPTQIVDADWIECRVEEPRLLQ